MPEFFSEDLAARFGKDKTNNENNSKRNENEGEIINFVEKERGEIVKNLVKWKIIKSSRLRVNIMIDAGASKPANQKASDDAY